MNYAIRDNVLRDIRVERERQILQEGWSESHDDRHDKGELAKAAGCYALAAGRYAVGPEISSRVLPVPWWPWAPEWWKPTTPRRMLIKAAALIVAEIERLDRRGNG